MSISRSVEKEVLECCGDALVKSMIVGARETNGMSQFVDSQQLRHVLKIYTLACPESRTIRYA